MYIYICLYIHIYSLDVWFAISANVQFGFLVLFPIYITYMSLGKLQELSLIESFTRICVYMCIYVYVIYIYRCIDVCVLPINGNVGDQCNIRSHGLIKRNIRKSVHPQNMVQYLRNHVYIYI